MPEVHSHGLPLKKGPRARPLLLVLQVFLQVLDDFFEVFPDRLLVVFALRLLEVPDELFEEGS